VVSFSGCRLQRFSPVYVAGRRHARIKLAPRRARQRLPGRPNQSAWYPGRFSRANPSSPVRFSLVSAARTLSRCRTDTALRRSDASLEVSVPFSACRPRCAVRGGQASGRSRFDVTSPVCDPRVPWNFVGPSLTDCVLAVFRFSDAMRLCSMCGRCVACLARRRRRVKAAATRGAARSTTVCDRSFGRFSGEPMLRATNDPSHQAPPLHGDLFSDFGSL